MPVSWLIIFLIGGALAFALVVNAMRRHRGLQHLLIGFAAVVATGIAISVIFLRTSIAARNEALARARAAQTVELAHARARALQIQRTHPTKVSSSLGSTSPTIDQDVLVAIEAPPHLTSDGLVVGDFVPLDEAPSSQSAHAAGDLRYSRGLDNAVRSRIADKLSSYFERLSGLSSPRGRGLIDEIADSVERGIRDANGDADQLYELRAALRRLPPAARRTLADRLVIECSSDICSQRFQMTDPKTRRATEVYACRIVVSPHRISRLANTLAAESRPRGALLRKRAIFTAGAFLVALVLLKVATRRHRLRHGP